MAGACYACPPFVMTAARSLNTESASYLDHGGPWWQADWLGNIPDLTEINDCAHELVLLGVVVDQLMLDGVQLEPAQLPGLEESSSLVEVALVQDV